MTENPEEVIQEDVSEETPSVPSQDPVEAELERVKAPKRSKIEKLKFTKERVERQLKEAMQEKGIEEDDLSRPLTLADLHTFQSEQTLETAMSLADTVQNAKERELVKYHLENTIKSSGDPQSDFKIARSLVNAVKNGQLVEEVARTQKPKTYASGSGAPAKSNKEEELTPDEIKVMKGFGLSKEEILKARS